MKRPLLITDCDEVLLYMVSHFRDWLAEEKAIHFDLGRADFTSAMTRVGSDEPLGEAEMWQLLGAFFDTEMGRQTPVEGAIAAIQAIRDAADVVVLTNLQDFRQEARAQQLRGLGLDLRVFTNQGPKGPALKAILDEYQPTRTVFIDDLAHHHGSVGKVAPEVTRLHLCAEARIAHAIPCALEAGHAHARIDTWEQALPWVLAQLTDEEKEYGEDE